MFDSQAREELKDLLIITPAEGQKKTAGYTSMIEVENQMQASFASKQLPIDIKTFTNDYFKKALKAETVPEAATFLARGIGRLPEDEQQKFSPELRGQMPQDQQHFYYENFSDVKDFVLQPNILRLTGSNLQKLSFWETVWGNVIAPFSGMKRGHINFRQGYEAPRSKEDFENPAIIANMMKRDYQRQELLDDQESLDLASPRLVDIAREFSLNAGDTVGGTVSAAMTPEAMLAAVTGAFGGPKGIIARWLMGVSAVQGRAAAGSNVWEIYREQPVKDPEAALDGFWRNVFVNFGSEHIGNLTMAKGLSKSVTGGLGKVANSIAPKATKAVTSLASGTGVVGVSSRLVLRSAGHTVPEVLTEGTQEFYDVMAHSWAAEKYNNKYKEQGFQAPVPTMQDALEASWAAMKQAAWGGAAPGLIGPGIQAWQEMGQREQAAVLDHAGKSMDKNLHINMVEKANVDLREKVKTGTEFLRADPELMENPIAAKEALDLLGKKTAFVKAETLETFFQEGGESPLNQEAAAEFLDAIGVAPEQFQEALEMGTDVAVDLNAIPLVEKSPYWDKVVEALTTEPQNVIDGLKSELADLQAEDPFIAVDLPLEVRPETKQIFQEQLMKAGQGRDKATASTEIISRMAQYLGRYGGIDPDALLTERLSVVKGQEGQASHGGLNQPMNEGVDIDKEVAIVVSRGDFANVPSYSLTKGSGRKELIKSIVGQYVNKETGWKIDVLPNGAEHAISSALKSSIDAGIHLDAVRQLAALIENAALIESHADTKGVKELKQVHRFYAPFESQGKTYAVKLTVKEFEGKGFIAEIESLQKLYDVKIEKEMPEGIRPRSPQERRDPGSASGKSLTIKIRDLIHNVKDNEGKPFQKYYQVGKSPRGSLDTLADGQYIISLFENADASTVMHEGAHMMVEEMRRLLNLAPEQIQDAAAHDQLKADLAALAQWAGQEDISGEWSTEAHEKIARGFETYLMEGKAPSPELNSIFQKMKKWLLSIYKSLANLNAPLNEEVREVFGRMLATEDEIFWANVEYDLPGHLSPEMQAELSKDAEKAKEAQAAELKKRRLAEYARQRRQWKKEAQTEADNDPRQLRITEIINNGGISRASFLAGGYTSEDIADLQRKRPGLVSGKDDADSFDGWAQRFDLDSDQFVMDLISGPSKEDLKNRYIELRKAEFDQYFDDKLPPSDDELIYLGLLAAAENLEGSPEGVKILKQVRKDLTDKGGVRKWKEIIHKHTGLRPISELDKKQMADLKAGLSIQAKAAKIGRAEGLSEGKEIGEAQGYKRGVRIGEKAGAAQKRFEMALQYKVKDQMRVERQKFEQLAKRLNHAKAPTFYEFRGLDPAYHEQIKQLLHDFGLGRAGQVEGSLFAFIAELEGRDEAVRVADWIKEGKWPVWETGYRAGKRKSYKELSYNEFCDLKDAVTNLIHLGRGRQQMKAAGRMWEVSALAGAIGTQIETNNELTAPKSHKEIIEGRFDKKGRFKKFMEKVPGFNAALIKVETICRFLDGGQIDGLIGKAIYGKVYEANISAMQLTDMATNGLREIVEQTIGAKNLRKMRGEKLIIPGFPFVLTREQALTLVLNSGNAGNLKALMQYEIDGQGNKLTMAHVEMVRNALSAEEINFAQMVWDFLDNEMFPRLNDLEKKNTGLPLKKVEAVDFKTIHGDFRGGYFPLAFDPEISERAQAQNERSANKDLMRTGAHQYTSVKSAATNARVGTTYQNLVPLLNLSVLSRSLNDNIHDLAYREAVRDVQKLIHRPQVKDSIIGALGREYFDQIPLWLQEVAKPGADKPKNPKVERFLGSLRNKISLATLGLKVIVVACQANGFTQSIQLLGTKHFLAGAKSYFSNMRKTTDFIYESSLEMKNRNKAAYDRDVADALATDNLFYKSMQEKYGEFAFKPIALTDQLVANVIWQGGYLRALEEGKNHEQAVYFADAIVRNTQPTGAVQDQSYMQRGLGYGQVGKLVTMYGTFFSATHNLGWEQAQYSKKDWKAGRKGKAVKSAARAALLLYALPALFDALIREEVPEDEEEFKEWLFDLGKGTFSYSVAGIPVVKDLMNYITGDSPRFKPTPFIDAIEGLKRGGTGAIDLATGEGDAYRHVKNIVRAAGYATGLPSGQALVTMDGVHDWDINESAVENLWHLLIRRPWEK